MPRKRARGNGEGSIYPYRNGYAAYAWVTTPTGKKRRKYVYGQDRETVHQKWISLLDEARRRPISTKMPTLETYLESWLADVVWPGLRAKTAEMYTMRVRLHIVPWLGSRRLDKLTVRDVRSWLNELATTCQCCRQGKDARRPPEQQCCSVGRCCGDTFSRWSLISARAVLRSALTSAVTDELVARNVAALVKIPKGKPPRKSKPWSVEEARAFLESAKSDGDPLYAAYVLVLALGLRRGEVLGLTWPGVRLEACEVDVGPVLQRIGGKLVLGEAKTEGSDAPLPLPGICLAALRARHDEQAEDHTKAGEAWQNAHSLVFTTRYGSPIEPRNFYRSFKRRCEKAGVRSIRVHDTRHTCGSLLAALDVHPRVAMQILRHSKINVTMEIYTHVPSPLTQAALKRLGESLESASGRDA